MIAEDHDDRVVAVRTALQGFEDGPDALVREARGGEVGLDRRFPGIDETAGPINPLARFPDALPVTADKSVDGKLGQIIEIGLHPIHRRLVEGAGPDAPALPLRRRAPLALRHSTLFLLGAEESYGYLADDAVRDKDANATVVMLCEFAALLRSRGRTLLDAVVAANGRASALVEAERSAAAEQGRVQRERFLTPGAGYQPGNARMFNN